MKNRIEVRSQAEFDAYLEPRPSADGKRFRNPCPITTEPAT